MNESQHNDATLAVTKPTRVRYRVIGVAALMSMLLYLDRFCISFVELYIQEDLRLTNSQVAWMLSAFFWTYALAQVPTGWLTDRFGSRIMLTLYVLSWSLFTGLTGGVAAFTALMLLRFGFGVAQAGAYPTASSMVSRWMPLERRGAASGVIAFGGRVGGVLALLASGYLLVWLTPPSTPTGVDADHFLNAGLVADQLYQQRPGATADAASTSEVDEDTQAIYRVRSLLFQNLSPEGRELVETLSAQYQAELARLSDEQPETDSANLTVNLAVPIEDREALAAEFNRWIQSPELLLGGLDSATLRRLPVESEVKRALKNQGGAENLGEGSARVNRLILEAAHPEGLQKLYVAGWRRLMYLYGSFGIIVGALIWFVCRTDPEQHPRVNAVERQLIEGSRKPSNGPARVPLKALVTSRSMWLCCMTQWFTNIGWLFLVTWAPRYYLDVHQLPTETRSLYVAIPPFIGWAGMLSGGVVTDWMVRRFGLRVGRVLPISFSRFLAMAAYIGCLFEPSALVAVVLLSVVAFSTDLGTAPVWAFTQDVGGKQVGSVLGWGNMWGNLGAAVTPPLLIWVIGEQENWDYAFIACAAAFFLSGVCAMGIDATKPIADD